MVGSSGMDRIVEGFRCRRRCLIRVSNYHHGGQARKVGDKVANGCTSHVSCMNFDLRHSDDKDEMRIGDCVQPNSGVDVQGVTW